LQAWLQDRVIAGTWATADDGTARDVVVGSDALPAEARIGIYAQSYVQRLAECLRTEFPALRALIGDQVFSLFVGGYLSARPPRSFTLYDLGAGFPDYLEATRPLPHSGPGTDEALPASLARLERAMAEAIRARGVEDARPPPDVPTLLHDPAARLYLPDSLRLLQLDFDFSATLATLRDGQRPELPVPQDCRVAVARSRYRVRVHRLEAWQFAWLSALGERAGDVQAATKVATGAGLDGTGAVLAALLIWLPLAFEAGFVSTE
jgi:hypothetical protein